MRRTKKTTTKSQAKPVAKRAESDSTRAARLISKRRQSIAAPAKSAARTPAQRRLVVGITGASGVIYGIRLLEALKSSGIESHLVLTRAAEMTIAYETDRDIKDVKALADKVYAIGDIGAAISSGSFQTLGMVVMPCSMKSLAEIATGVTGSLLSRAADAGLLCDATVAGGCDRPHGRPRARPDRAGQRPGQALDRQTARLVFA